MHHRMKRKYPKRPKKTNSSADCTRIYIIGDSILKHEQGCEISKSLENCITYVKSFSGAKITDMQDYLNPALQEKPDQIAMTLYLT